MTVDQRVVQMQFDNAQFERGVASTQKSLETLNRSLQLQGATKGLSDVASASKNVQLGHISSAVDGLAQKFSALGIAGVTALSNITNRVVDAGLRLAKSLTIDPISSGLKEYETNLNSIQTILANTAHEGTNLKQVNAALAELNRYSDQTIYNFSEMARNIGTFTAAGVSLKTSTEAIKGIANLAAISGSNSQQASAAMYQLSQALSAGKVSLEDWNSVVNSGMGGKVFQDALTETARTHGVAIDKMIKDEGSFRLTLQKGWLTSDILTETLSKFTGDLNAKQLKTMGYTDKQITQIIKLGKMAQAAATEVKTASQLISTLQESVGSGWAETWQLVFGDFEEAKTLWTGVNNVVGDFVKSSAEARNKVLGDWKKLGGRTALIDGIKNAFQALISIAKPIGDAFRQIFPATTGKQLYEMTVAIRDFMANLKIGADTANNLRRTFAGVFAVFGIGWEVIKQVASTLFELFGVITEGSGGFLEFTANIGDFLVALHSAIKNGEDLKQFFQGLGSVLAIPIRFIKALASAIASFFSNLDGPDLGAKFEPMAKVGEVISSAWNKVISVMGRVSGFFAPLASRLANFFGNLGRSIAETIQNLNFGDVLGAINTGLFAGLVLMLKNFLGNFGQQADGGLFDGIKGAIEGLTDTLGAMQNTLRAATLLQIALAIGILTLSVSTLSKIDGEGLTRALTAITVMFTQLAGALIVFEKISGFAGFAKMPIVAGAMILLAIAANILATAVTKLAGLDWNGLAKGLTGMTVILGALVATVRFMPNPAGLISTGLGLIVLAGAIKILVSAVKDLSGLSWEEMAKGLVGVAGLLGALALFTKFSKADAGGLAQGAGIILLAVGIKILASAMDDLGGLSWEEIAKGLVAMAGGLTLIAGALLIIPPTSIFSAAAVLVVAASLGMISDALASMGSMSWGSVAKGLVSLAGSLVLIAAALVLLPPSSLLSAAAIFVVASSLGMIADALGQMGSMTWEEIAKGLIVLAGSLTIIAAAMLFMTMALPGAAALLIVSAALGILTPILQTLGSMSLAEIGTALLALVGVFVVLGAAGILLGPLVPVLIGLGIAVTLLGVGMLAAGAGVLAFSIGLTALSAAGAAGTAAIVGIVAGLVGLIPMVMEQIALGLIAFAKVIGVSGPAITKAIETVLNSLIDAIGRLTPKIVNTLLKMLAMLVSSLANYVPKMVSSGLKLLVGILTGVANNIGKVVTAATNVVTKFIEGVANNIPKVIQSGVNLILKFVNSLANAIRNNSAAMGVAGANLASAIVTGMGRGLAAGAASIAAKARQIAVNALNAAKNALGISSPSKEFEKIGKFVNEGFIKGLDGNKADVWKAFADLKELVTEARKSALEDYKQIEARLKKLNSARKKDISAIKKAKSELAQARKEYEATGAALKHLTTLNVSKTSLGNLTIKFDQLTEKIKAADDALKDAIKTRDDYNKSIKEQYSDLPEITPETKLVDYLASFRKQIDDTRIFAYALQRLRDLGLNDQMYKELLSKGSAALPFISQVLDGGKSSVDELNKLGSQLGSTATALGSTASKELYQAGVKAAEGLLKGLQTQQAAIEKQMDKIAAAMVASIKKKLGIKSPSIEFAKLGKYSAEGLAQGLKESSVVIERSAEGLGENAILSLRNSLSGLSKVFDSDIDLTPTITPVLDLTSVQRNAGKIGSMLLSKSISVGSNYARARDISGDHMSTQAAIAEANLSSRGDNLTFHQYNNSPKALSAAEVYRQTKNQLSVAKGALTN